MDLHALVVRRKGVQPHCGARTYHTRNRMARVSRESNEMGRGKCDVVALVDHRHRVLMPAMPQAAWRLLNDFLRSDHGFCHSIIPYFRPLGYVVVCISGPHTDDTVQPDKSL